MAEDDPFESELVAAAKTARAERSLVTGLFHQLDLARRLLSEAGDDFETPALIFRGRDGKVCVQSVGRGVSVGRGSECELCFRGLREISRLHFSITLDEQGHYWIADPGSLNGTFLRGQADRIVKCELVNGDVIDVGGFTFLFVQR